MIDIVITFEQETDERLLPIVIVFQIKWQESLSPCLEIYDMFAYFYKHLLQL